MIKTLHKVVLYEAGYIVNDLIHKEMEKQSTSRKLGLTGDHDLLSLDIDEQLQRVDPLLLEFMTCITATVRQR